MYLNEEEAIYLLIKCHLVLFDENDVIVTVETLLAEKSSQFLVKCKVYSYFKDRNFIVRAGINFGVDYTVYRSLPHLCHSEYCVLAMDCTEGNETVAESGFRYLTAQSRTMSVSFILFQ